MKLPNLEKLDFNKSGGLIPAIIQNAQSGQVLMLGFMSKESLGKTMRTKKVWFYSRSKGRLWMKGEESKNILKVVSIATDCDRDSLLVLVDPVGPTCHTGQVSCFGKLNTPQSELGFIAELWNTIKSRQNELPKNSYTASLFKKGIDAIVQKVGEEATEVVIAGKNSSKQRLIEESCDLLYHLFVLLTLRAIKPEEIDLELKMRAK